MNTRKSSIVAVLAAVGLLCTTAAALASQKAVVSEDADLHAKPKVSSAVMDTVDQDEVVKVTQCQGNWCFVTHPGPDGWIKRLYLTNDDGSDFTYGDSGTSNGGNPPVNCGLSVGPNGPSFSCNNGGPPGPAPVPTPTPTPAVAQVCFFADPNFGGVSACYTPGESDNNMAITGPGYDNNISSIKFTGGAKVKVCTDAFFAGTCATLTSDKPFLGGYDNTVSSFQVY